MKQWLTDPVVQLCSGIILIGIIGLIWAIGKLRQGSSSSAPLGDFGSPGPGPDLREIEFQAPAMSARAPIPAPVPPPAVSRDVAERLDSMTQRLTEMQAVLSKQAVGAGAGTVGGVGQGFSPETVDKLLKIIGNVIQQVDILQKSMAVTAAPKENPFTKV